MNGARGAFMNRRGLLMRFVAAGGGPLWASSAAQAQGAATWQAQFDAAQAPWKSAFASAPAGFALTAASVRGRFPDAVAGTLYRIGPAGHDLGGERYHHWFDGDGMAHRFVIAGRRVHHQGRYVATARRRAEVTAGRRLTEGFGTVFPDRAEASSPDSMNAANISVLPVGADLLALWEGGSATRLDPHTLETRGLKTWRADLAGVPFSAHPRVDADGTIWNFGVDAHRAMLLLYEIAPDGALRRAQAFPVDDMPMVHDFALTAGHLVFLLPPLVYDTQRRAAGASVLDAYVWRPEIGLRALVIDRTDWTRQQLLHLPAGFLFHLGNAWEQAGDPGRAVIHLDYARAPDASHLLSATREVMRGRLTGSVGPSLTVASLDLHTGKASQTDLSIEAEFPRIHPRRVGQQHRQVLHATHTRGGVPMWSAIALTDVETGASQTFSYGAQAIAEEHVWVPDGAGPGWVIGTVLDYVQNKTMLSCFAADALADGPVAQATLPYALPLGLHGTFVAA